MSLSSSPIESLKKLKHGKAKSGQKWIVYTTVYNRDLIGKVGKADDEHGLIIFIGACETYEEAKKLAIEKMGYSGYPYIEIAKTLHFNKLNFGSQKEFSEGVIFDEDTKNVSEYQKAIWKEKEEEKKKRTELKESIDIENDNEKDVNHIEHYKRNVMLAIENRNIARGFEKRSIEMRAKYEERLSAAIKHYSNHPEHEDELLPFLKKKLEERGESHIFQTFEKEYSDFRRRIIEGAKIKDPTAFTPGKEMSVVSPRS